MGKRKRNEPNQWDGKALYITQLVKNSEDPELIRQGILEMLDAAYRQGLADAIAEARGAT